MKQFKWSVFAREYLLDQNGAAAAIRAGYAAGTARQRANLLLKRPEVQAILTASLAKHIEKTAVTKDWITQKTIDVLNRAEMDGQHTAARGCLELLAKLHGHIIERKDVRRVNSWHDLSDEELDKLANDPSAPAVRH